MNIVDYWRIREDDAIAGVPTAKHKSRCGCVLVAQAALTSVPGVVGLLLGIESACDDHMDLTPDATEGFSDFFVEEEGDITIEAALASYADRLVNV